MANEKSSKNNVAGMLEAAEQQQDESGTVQNEEEDDADSSSGKAEEDAAVRKPSTGSGTSDIVIRKDNASSSSGRAEEINDASTSKHSTASDDASDDLIRKDNGSSSGRVEEEPEGTGTSDILIRMDSPTTAPSSGTEQDADTCIRKESTGSGASDDSGRKDQAEEAVRKMSIKFGASSDAVRKPSVGSTTSDDVARKVSSDEPVQKESTGSSASGRMDKMEEVFREKSTESAAFDNAFRKAPTGSDEISEDVRKVSTGSVASDAARKASIGSAASADAVRKDSTGSGTSGDAVRKDSAGSTASDEAIRKASTGTGTSEDVRKESSGKAEELPTALRLWLEGLRGRAELETMSVLYAKSVVNHHSQHQHRSGAAGATRKTTERVPIRDRCASGGRNNNADAAARDACRHAPTTARVGSQPSLLQAPSSPLAGVRAGVTRVRLHGSGRSSTCTSGGAGAVDTAAAANKCPSGMVMKRQSIVLVPDPEWAEAADGADNDGTLTKFAKSLPNGACLGERLQPQQQRRREWTPPATRRARQRPTPPPPPDYAELPLCGEPPKDAPSSPDVYQPSIKYRRNRKGGAGATNRRRKSPRHGGDASAASGGLAVRPVAFRHSIRVNNDASLEDQLSVASSADCGGANRSSMMATGPPCLMAMSLFSRVSPAARFGTFHSHFGACGVDGDDEAEGSSSLDSGQGSGGSPPFLTMLHQHHHRRGASEEEEEASSEASSSCMVQQQHGTLNNNNSKKLPSFGRTASCIAQVLRLSSAIFAQLGASSSCNNNSLQKLLDNTKAYLRLLAQCPCAGHMPQSDLELVRRAMRDAEHELRRDDVAAEHPAASGNNNDYLAVCVRRMLEQTLLVFVRLISQYLSECANHDRLLLIALEQLIHLLLFGDELCLEAIRHKAMDNLLGLAQAPLTGADTLKLLLRTMAVLCGTAKGCLQLLSIGGLDLVLRVLRDSAHADCSVEAAGCLAQLCSPAHCFLRLSPQSLLALVPRLLQLAERAPSPESLLLSLAALANLGAQASAGPLAELLYTHNAVLRLVRAAQRSHSAGNLFVQEELITILTRMANRGYERALLAQGAVPLLCRLLKLGAGAYGGHPHRQSEFQRRVAYKAAVCLGTLASTGAGLRALHQQGVHKVLSDTLISTENQQKTAAEIGTTTSAPVQLICASIMQRLENTYQLETAV